jgi:hypothetical protein
MVLRRSQAGFWTIALSIATWIVTLVWILIFAAFWRMKYAPPHAAWAILSIGTITAIGFATVLLCLRQLLRGPKRLLAVALLIVGTAPIVWIAMFLLALYLQVVTHTPRRFDVPVRIAAFWAASVGDLEARWRYSRWTTGKHVILLDDGKMPVPEKLVAQMDEHIEQMAVRLQSSVPTEKARWVRGSLLWLNGVAVLTWAICDAERNSPELTALDRHEMAHATITAMGDVDQDPPMLLCEGWAESQSKERAALILPLQDKAEQGSTCSLQELVEPDWYRRSFDPVYDHGGALAIYLIEHYGAAKFSSLYHSVRFSTFASESEHILGDSWPVVESQFWQWLASEAETLKTRPGGNNPPTSQTAADVKLAKPVNPLDWQAIVDGYQAAWSKRPPMPKTCAFEVDRTWTTPSSADTAAVTHEESIKYVVDGNCLWRICFSLPDGSKNCDVFTTALAASVHMSADGRVKRNNKPTERNVTAAIDYADKFGNQSDLGRQLPLHLKRPYSSSETQIQAIRSPAASNQSVWQIDYINRPSQDVEIVHHTRFDAAADWLVLNEQIEWGTHRSETQYKLASIFGRKAATEASTRTADAFGEWPLHVNVRELTPAEAQELRQEAETIVRRIPARDWYTILVRPLTLAIGWPAAGVLLLGILMVCRHGENRSARAE